MGKGQVFLAVLGACIGTMFFLWILWYLAPFLIIIIGIIGFFMLIGYIVESAKSGD